MKKVYQCEYCGKINEDREVIYKCESSHNLEPEAFLNKLQTRLGKKAKVHFRRYTGTFSYSLEIEKYGLIIVRQVITTISEDVINDIVRKVLKIDRVFAEKSICFEFTEEDKKLVDSISKLNDNRAYYIKIGFN